MTRLSPVTPETLSAAQKEVFDRLSSRNGMVGPYPILLRSAELSSRLEALGRYVRFEAGIPERPSKVAILVIARHWRSAFEWGVHAKAALTLGLPDAVVNAIGANQRPVFADPAEAIVYDYTRELVETGAVTDATFKRAQDAFDEMLVMHLGVLVGFYSLLALTMNALEVEAPDGGATLPW